MIFPSINALFIHIPKCAGMTIIRFLIENKINPIKVNFHAVVKDFYDDKILDLFKFTFVRNPWDRIASHYYFHGPGAPEWPTRNIITNSIYRISTKRQYMYPKGFYPKSFREFVIDDVCNNNIVPSRKNLFISQPITERLKNNQNEIDLNFIGRVENFESDLTILMEKLNLDLTLPKKVNAKPDKIIYNNLYDSYLYDVVKDYII